MISNTIFSLSGKVAIVTGGSGFLGIQFSTILAQAGATVIIADNTGQHCMDVAADLTNDTGAQVVAVEVDLADELSVRNFRLKVHRDFGSVDILVNNAATKAEDFFAPLNEYSLKSWNDVMAVNVSGIFLMVREFSQGMLEKRKGSIVNISSIYGVVGPDNRIYEGSWHADFGRDINTPLVYSASKGAVIAMSRHLATTLGPYGVRVNTLTPGGVEAGQNDTFKDRYSARVPLGRMAQRNEMAAALLFLASDASSYVNGQNLIVDGGWTAW